MMIPSCSLNRRRSKGVICEGSDNVIIDVIVKILYLISDSHPQKSVKLSIRQNPIPVKKLFFFKNSFFFFRMTVSAFLAKISFTAFK